MWFRKTGIYVSERIVIVFRTIINEIETESFHKSNKLAKMTKKNKSKFYVRWLIGKEFPTFCTLDQSNQIKKSTEMMIDFTLKNWYESI